MNLNSVWVILTPTMELMCIYIYMCVFIYIYIYIYVCIYLLVISILVPPKINVVAWWSEMLSRSWVVVVVSINVVV